MIRSARFGAVLLALAVLLPGAARAQFAMAERFTPSVITNALGETMPVRVWHRYAPKDKPVPTLVLLHGSGECGTDNASQLQSFKSFYDTLLIDDTLPPALILVPQCTQSNPWVRRIAFTADYVPPRYPAPALKNVKYYLDQLVKDGTADPKRLYIGGLSLGGFGTWDAIQRWPNYFAAAVPVCAGGSVREQDLKNAGTTSIWVFHGSADPAVSVECSRRMVGALGARGTAPRYTEYPNAGHAVWHRAFSDKAMLNWLFRQRLGNPEHADTGDTGLFGGVLKQLKDYVTPGS